jgi:hypothetical protein
VGRQHDDGLSLRQQTPATFEGSQLSPLDVHLDDRRLRGSRAVDLIVERRHVDVDLPAGRE